MPSRRRGPGPPALAGHPAAAETPAVATRLSRDLKLRVAGYSDYFCDLSEALQDEIIRRTEHREF